MIDRKIKKWGNWYKAERWLEEMALQNQEGLENPKVWWVFMDQKFPTGEERREALLSGWKLEVVSSAWWKKMMNSMYPETADFYTQAEQKQLWLLVRQKEEKADLPKWIENQKDCWILYENQMWSKERLEKKGLIGPTGTMEAKRLEMYGGLGKVSWTMVSSLESPSQRIATLLDRKARGDV